MRQLILDKMSAEAGLLVGIEARRGRILPRVRGRVAGEVVLTGGGDNYTVESTPDSVVTLLNSTPAVADRLTASGSGSTPLQALPSTPLSGGVARASVVTAAALVALFQGVSSVAEAMMAEVTGDPAALVQPAQVYLSGGVEPASVSTVNEVVALLNGTPEVTALFQTTGSGETVVGAGSASLSGGGEQATLTGTRTYGWDVHGRLAQVSLPGGQVHSYSYDYRTRRIGLQQTASGTDPAKTTAVVFSGGLSLAEYESTTAQATIASPGQSTVRYVRGPDMGGGVGGLLYSRRAQAVKFNLSNGRGDIVAQSDTSGALTWTASYEAYGKRTKETGENLDKQRGNSKDEDPTGLLNEGFRYRDLETGVWLSRDPAGFVDGPNVYAYVKQNPWTCWDPHGLSAFSDLQESAANDIANGGTVKGYAKATVAALWNAFSFGNAERMGGVEDAARDGGISLKQAAVEAGKGTALAAKDAALTYGSGGLVLKIASKYDKAETTIDVVTNIAEGDYTGVVIAVAGEMMPAGKKTSNPGGQTAREISDAVKTTPPIKNLTEQAADLVPLNGGRNRVTLRSPSQRMDVDLAGKPHGGVPTPHTKVSPLNPRALNQPAYNTKNSPTKSATQQDIRTVRRYLERQNKSA